MRLEAFEKLAKFYDAYTLSKPPWDKTSAWSDKHPWVKKHLGETAKRD